MITLKKYLTNTSDETLSLGKDFSDNLNPGDIILMYGELGAGKTTFTKGIAKGLGVKDRILSPTFVLHRSHDVNLKNIRVFNHIDLYRIDIPEDIKNLGIDEVVKDPEAITVIEWADRIEFFKIDSGYKIFFKHLNNENREIKISKI
jgi:tRNA threonylcarbamoyladenosine biosynthesis protein TsaE